jgi:hypothetical protein
VKVGDLVRTIEGWSYKTWTGIVVGVEASEDWVKVLWTEVSTTDGQIFWAPVRKLEVINATR